MADEKFDIFADRMIDLVKELRGETTQLNKEMEGAKKQTKGMLDFLTKTDSRFVKFSKLATTAQADASLKRKAFAQTWLAVRRISAKVSYDAYALQSTIVGAFDTMKAVSDTARLIQGVSAEKAKEEKEAEKTKLELIEEQRQALIKMKDEKMEEIEAARAERVEQINYLKEKQQYEGGLVFDDYKLLEALEARDRDTDEEKELLQEFNRLMDELNEETKEEREKQNKSRLISTKFYEGYKKIFAKISPNKIAKVIQNVGKMAVNFIRFVATFVAVAAAFYLFAKQVNLKEILLSIWDGLQAAFVFIKQGILAFIDGLGMVITGVVGVFTAIDRLLDGDFEGFLDAILPALGQILFGVLLAAGGLISAVIVGAVEFLSVMVDSYLSRMASTGQGILSSILNIVIAVTTIAFAIGFIASGAWLYTAATFLVGAIAAALTRGIIPFANGGIVSNRGMQLVGERGPELVSLPVGSRVHSNRESRAMGSTTNITVNVQGRIGASDAELRDIAQKIGRMVNMEVNRTTASRTRGA